MQVARLGSVRNRLLLLFFAITAAAVGFVYLYVVPQLQSSLTSQKLSLLEDRGSRQSARLLRAMRTGLRQQELDELLRRVSQATDSRVTLLGVRNVGGVQTPAFVIGDSQSQAGPVSTSFDVAAGATDGQIRAGTEVISGSHSAEVAVPLPSSRPVWIAVFSQSLGEVSDNVALIKRQILIAGAIALALSLLAGFWAARAI